MNKYQIYALMLAVMLLALSGCSSVDLSSAVEMMNNGSENVVSPTGRLELSCDEENGLITVFDKKTGNTWRSSPTDGQMEKETAEGIGRNVLLSNLVIYTVEPGDNDNIIAQNRWASYNGAVTTGGLTVEEIENGYRITYAFKRAQVVVPLEVRLKGESVVVSIDYAAIQENGTHKLLWASIMPYFGAGSFEDEGYLVVPDGCGALINFNNGKASYDAYKEPIYGFDETYMGQMEPQVKKGLKMPVFGIVNNGAALLGIVSHSAGNAGIEAVTSGQANGFNTVYPTFYFYASDQLMIGSSSTGASRSIVKYAFNRPLTNRCEVQYLFPDEGDYSSIAKKYQEYLIAHGDAKRGENKTSMPLYVGFFGGLLKRESVAGFSVNRYNPMTTFDNGIEIMNDLTQRGVNKLVVQYSNWTSQQAHGQLQTNDKAARQLGGEKGRNRFINAAKSLDADVFFSYDPLVIRKSSLSFLSFFHAARKIGGSPIQMHTYMRANGYIDTSIPPGYLPDYERLYKNTLRYVKAADRTSDAGLYYPQLTSHVYSSLSPKNFVDRDTAIKYMNAILAEGRQPKMGEYSNIYAVDELAYILAAPTSTTMQNIVDESIPFYQLVISGLTEYSTANINFYGNIDIQTLKAVETGAGLYFSFVYSDPSIFMETEHSDMYGTDYHNWAQDAVERHMAVNALFDKIGSTELISHRKLDEGVFYSVYKGGAGVITNYRKDEYKFNGKLVGPMGWMFVESEGI